MQAFPMPPKNAVTTNMEMISGLNCCGRNAVTWGSNGNRNKTNPEVKTPIAISTSLFVFSKTEPIKTAATIMPTPAGANRKSEVLSAGRCKTLDAKPGIITARINITTCDMVRSINELATLPVSLKSE